MTRKISYKITGLTVLAPSLSKKDSVLGIVNAPAGDGEGCLVLGEVGAVVDLGNPGLSPPFPQRDPDQQTFQSQKLITELTNIPGGGGVGDDVPPDGLLGISLEGHGGS